MVQCQCFGIFLRTVPDMVGRVEQDAVTYSVIISSDKTLTDAAPRLADTGEDHGSPFVTFRKIRREEILIVLLPGRIRPGDKVPSVCSDYYVQRWCLSPPKCWKRSWVASSKSLPSNGLRLCLATAFFSASNCCLRTSNCLLVSRVNSPF